MAYTTGLATGTKPLTLSGWACDPNLVTGASTVIVEWMPSGGSTWTQHKIVADKVMTDPTTCIGDHGFATDLDFIPSLAGVYVLRLKTSDILATQRENSLVTLPFVDKITKVATLTYTVTIGMYCKQRVSLHFECCCGCCYLYPRIFCYW